MSMCEVSSALFSNGLMPTMADLQVGFGTIMEIMTTTAVHNNKDMDLSGGNSSFWEEKSLAKTRMEIDYAFWTLSPNLSLKIMSLVIYNLVFVLGVLGNGVVIWVTGFKMKKTVSTVWYLNLSVADFLVTAFLPLRITETALDDHWPFGTFMCKMDGTVFFMNMYASIYTLMVISVDRCVCVVCPVWAQNHRSVRKASWVSLGVWVLALALSSPNFKYRVMPPSSTLFILCLYYFDLPMIITHNIMGFMVPFTVIVSCYSVIIYRLRNNRSLASQSGRRPFKIIATVITAFFLCWVPFHIIHLIRVVNFLELVTESPVLHRVVYFGIPMATGLALLNSCLNPLLYVFMGQDFKDVLRVILKVMEKAFAEELPQTNSYTNPGSSLQETALSQQKV